MMAKMRATMEHEILEDSADVRPAAVRYVHQFAIHAQAGYPWRSQREMATLARILDLLASGRPGAAADVAAQRLKAVEKAQRDGHWDQAKFLELVPQLDVTMANRQEEYMAAKESRLAVQAGGNKGKGSGKGKDKNSKGKANVAPAALTDDRNARRRR